MKRKVVIHFILIMTFIVFLGLALTTVDKKKPSGSPTYFATLTISDGFPGTMLSSDSKGSYVDWRLEGDPCVKAKVKENGFFFIYFYRGSDLGADCEFAYPDEKRRYCLEFPEKCSFLGLDSPCQLDTERIRAENLFQKRAQETSISFMFHLDGESYTLDTAGDINGSGDTRTVYNTYRNAQLWKFTGQKKPKRVLICEFIFPFELTVMRVAQ